MMTTKGVLFILDGLGDRPSPALKGKTPLEAAYTPNLDDLTTSGLCGLVNPLSPWVPAGTQAGSSLLMGLARADIPYLTRGPIEAAGVGIPLQEGDVALRCNFATLEPNGPSFTILDRRAGRIAKGTIELARKLSGLDLGDGITARFRASTQHRAVLVLSGANLSPAITDTDPGAGTQIQTVLRSEARYSQDVQAIRTAQALNTFIQKGHQFLKDHPINIERQKQGLLPANGLITRGAGQHRALRNLLHLYDVKVATVTGEGTIVGLSRLFGFDVTHKPSFTATPETDLEAKIQATQQALKNHDLVFVHIKGTDTAAHDCRPHLKKTFLEAIDRAITPLMDQGLVLGITGDHTTDSNVGRHTGDPVPACISAPYARQDGVEAFHETACMQGGLGHVSATAFLCAVLDLMNVTHIFKPHEHGYFGL